MDTWRYLPLSTNNAAMNMAIDEAIVSARIAEKVPDTLRLYRWQPSAVSIGRNQILENEVYLATAKQLGVDVVRRISGGGTVYHDFDGEITYTVVAKTSNLGNADVVAVYSKIYDCIRDAFRILGTGADFSTGDAKNCPNLTVNSKKISGSSQAITRGVVLQHGTILINVDLPKMFRLLQLKGASCSQAADVGKRKITSLENELGHKISPVTVAHALAHGFSAMLKIQLEAGKLTPEENEMANRLYVEKYSSEEWNLGTKSV